MPPGCGRPEMRVMEMQVLAGTLLSLSSLRPRPLDYMKVMTISSAPTGTQPAESTDTGAVLITITTRRISKTETILSPDEIIMSSEKAKCRTGRNNRQHLVKREENMVRISLCIHFFLFLGFLFSFLGFFLPR